MNLINRDDAIAVAMHSKDPVEGIKHLPAVDAVEVKHGRWTENEHITFDSVWGEDVHWFTFTCSVCGGETMKDYPYCPNCGARKDGEK